MYMLDGIQDGGITIIAIGIVIRLVHYILCWSKEALNPHINYNWFHQVILSLPQNVMEHVDLMITIASRLF